MKPANHDGISYNSGSQYFAEHGHPVESENILGTSEQSDIEIDMLERQLDKQMRASAKQQRPNRF